MSKLVEGQLFKYTNVIKGWQFRWFVLDCESQNLLYYLDKDKTKQTARGSIVLQGSVIIPSEEDSVSFTINAQNGESYKLRAADSKERQHWISQIRLHCEVDSSGVAPVRLRTSSVRKSKSFISRGSLSQTYIRNSTSQDGYPGVRDQLDSVEDIHTDLCYILDLLPAHGDRFHKHNEDILLLKALASATVQSLEKCYSILQKGVRPSCNNSLTKDPAQDNSSLAVIIPSQSQKTEEAPLSPAPWSEKDGNTILVPSSLQKVGLSYIQRLLEGAVEDVDSFKQAPKLDFSIFKTATLGLLSQLKLGMDLTRVVFPTFILEPKSLLEMYSEFFCVPELFSSIADWNSPEKRLLAVIKFYLSSFHAAGRTSVPRKPYNPLLGEHFACVYQSRNASSAATSGRTGDCEIYFVAEQVSHHPPVSAFFAECPAKGIYMNTNIWTKSKFYGMSVGGVNVGEGRIYLSAYNEEYILTFPNTFCRSLVTNPWMELCGRTFVDCPKTGFSATLIFHPKPAVEGRANKVTAELRHTPSRTVFGTMEGFWDSSVVFRFMEHPDRTEMLDIHNLVRQRKMVLPPSKQDEFESRRLWSKVSAALGNEDYSAATQAKLELEQNQRIRTSLLSSGERDLEHRFFSKVAEEWLFRDHPKRLNLNNL